MGGCLALLTVFAGAGLYELMHKIQNHTHLQVNLDQCTGTFIANLRAVTLTMEESYQRMEVYRVAVVAGCLNPLDCPALLKGYNTVAKIEKKIQEGARIFWKEQSGIWNEELTNRCAVPLMLGKSKFPDFNFPIISGGEGDLASLRSTRFVFSPPQAPTTLSLRYLNLISTAELKNEGSFNAWSIYWSQ